VSKPKARAAAFLIYLAFEVTDPELEAPDIPPNGYPPFVLALRDNMPPSMRPFLHLLT